MDSNLVYGPVWFSDFEPPYTPKEARPQREVAEYVAEMLSLAATTTEEMRGVALSLLQAYGEHVPPTISQGTRENAMTFARACGAIEAACRSLRRVILLTTADLQKAAGVEVDLPEDAERPTPKPPGKGAPEFALVMGAHRLSSEAKKLSEVFNLIDLNLRAALDTDQKRRPLREYGSEERKLFLADKPLSVIEAATADLHRVLAPPAAT